jgi:type II secretory pathway pseudopilin PulG
MMYQPGIIKKNQFGFTLLEMLIGLAVTILIGSGLTAAVSQMINVNALSTNRMTAIKQLENALHIISRDAQMAQMVTIDGSAFLELTWYERDDARQDYSKRHEVTYTVLPDGTMQKVDSITPEGQGTQTTVSNIAQDISSDSALTNCSFTSGVPPSAGTLTIKLTAVTGGYKSATETRTVQIALRSNP